MACPRLPTAMSLRILGRPMSRRDLSCSYASSMMVATMYRHNMASTRDSPCRVTITVNVDNDPKLQLATTTINVAFAIFCFDGARIAGRSDITGLWLQVWSYFPENK